MRWVRDTTGRFSRRPYYRQDYLDQRCEQLIFAFLNELYGQITIPVPNGAILKLIERDARDLNLYAELPESVLGVTYFDPPRKPTVRIARSLFEDPRQLHRIRFTLCHEYGHVRIHAPLYQRSGAAMREDHECKDVDVEPSRRTVDWMEWQAGYAAGALLMPLSRVSSVVQACVGADQTLPLSPDDPTATNLKQRVSEAFLVSQEASAVRLSQLGYIRSRQR
jgi:hypothetical protein